MSVARMGTPPKKCVMDLLYWMDVVDLQTALKKATSFHRVQARAIVLHDQIRFITRPVKDLMLCNDWIKYLLKAFFWYLSSVQIKWLYDLLNVLVNILESSN